MPENCFLSSERGQISLQMSRFNLRFCNMINMDKLRAWIIMYFGGCKLPENKLHVWSMILWKLSGDQSHLVAWATSTLTFTSGHFTSCFHPHFSQVSKHWLRSAPTTPNSASDQGRMDEIKEGYASADPPALPCPTRYKPYATAAQWVAPGQRSLT